MTFKADIIKKEKKKKTSSELSGEKFLTIKINTFAT